MNTNLNIFNDSETDNSNSFTELRISNLKEPILDNNDAENINPNEHFAKSSQKELYQSKSSKNSLFSSDIKISYRTELFQEIEKNNYKKVYEILNKDISQINDYNIDGLTPLHLGVIKGNIKIINLLLEKGSNPNALSLSKNQTPLHFSYLNQNENTDYIIKDLLNHGAKENILDINNKKPSDYLNINLNTSNSNNSLHIKYNNIKQNNNNIKLNNGTNNRNNLNGMNGSQNSERNKSISNSYETTIINSISSQKENKSNEGYNRTSLDGQKKINLNDLVTPIKYPCLVNLKEESQKKGSINDSLEIESININFNGKINENSCPLLNENDIKNYKSIQSLTSFNDNVDLTYTTSMIVDQSNNKKTSNKKDSLKKINKENMEDKSLNNININKKIDYSSEPLNIDEIYKALIMKKRDSIAKTYKKRLNKIYLYNNFHGKTEKSKKKIFIENYINNIMSSERNSNKNITVIHNSNSYLHSTDKFLNKSSLEYSPFSTDIQTGKRQLNIMDNRKVLNMENKAVTEFIYDNSISEEEEKNKNEHLTSLANELVNNSNNLKTIDENINNSYNEIKNWLISINLINYYDNFINNEIYDICQLINRMKSTKTKLNLNDIESLLKTDKKGHCFRILVRLEVDAGLIDTKITNFMLNNIYKKNNNNANIKNNNLKLSISYDYNNCFGCCKFNFINSSKKNDLKYFLLRYELMDLYPNFIHNGFDLINYVILQMYSDNPINDDILENCFHIYNYEKRIIVLKALETEMKKINYFLDSNEYHNNPKKDMIKYENIIFTEHEESLYIYEKNNKKLCNDCLIY